MQVILIDDLCLENCTRQARIWLTVMTGLNNIGNVHAGMIWADELKFIQGSGLTDVWSWHIDLCLFRLDLQLSGHRLAIVVCCPHQTDTATGGLLLSARQYHQDTHWRLIKSDLMNCIQYIT